MTHLGSVLLVGLILTTWLVGAGCGGKDDGNGDRVGENGASTGDADAGNQVPQAQGVRRDSQFSGRAGDIPFEVTSGDSQVQTTPAEVSFDSPEGQYHIVWPEGCSRLRTRTQTDKSRGEPGIPILTNTFCDRKDRYNEGCAVTTYYRPRADDGGPPTPRTVIEICKKAMTKFGVTIVAQQPIRRGGIEGIQLHCREQGQAGEVWLEGLLAGEKIYILMAWRATGGLFTDPEFMSFFASFTLTG